MSTVVSKTHILQAKNLPLSKVTVYHDRAELSRLFSINLATGLNTVLIEGVAKKIDDNSIRVDGLGNATIYEVQFKEDSIPRNQVNTPQVEQLRADLEEIRLKKANNDVLDLVYTKHLQSINDILETYGKSAVSGQNAVFTPFNDALAGSLDSLYGFHQRKSVDLSEKLRSNSAELAKLEGRIKRVEEKLNNLLNEETHKKSIVITLGNESKTETKVKLKITYLVSNATWSPSYDIRVQADETKLKLSYYGNIRQNSGEDWNDVRLVLSTARPSSGGTLPKFGTLQASFGYASNYATMAMKRSCRSTDIVHEDEDATEAVYSCMSAPAESPKKIRVAKASAEEQMLSTTFNIPQTKTIPCVGHGDATTTEHKVTIVVLELDSVHYSECVPSKNTDVYLTATAVNDSSFPLLAGEASIFVDNCFTTKVDFYGVNAGEKFTCSLGINPAIKVVYKPVHEFHQKTGGIIGGIFCKTTVLEHEQKIVARNTKSDPAILTVFEHIPKSTDEKIKIVVLEPKVEIMKSTDNKEAVRTNELPKMPEVGARLNPANNLEWTIQMDGNEAIEMTVKWQMKYPVNKPIRYNEVYEKK